jgi:hypothetical protein
MTAFALVGTISLGLSLSMILWLCALFARLGNGRFLHFRMFFGIQAVLYASAVLGTATSSVWWVTLARLLTPISYVYLVWGMRRSGLQREEPS